MDSDLIQYEKLAKANRLPPLFVAASLGLPYCTYYLLTKCCVDVNLTCCGATALQFAIKNSHMTVVKLLLSQPGIRLNRQINSKYGGLHTAIHYSDESILPLLLKQSRTDVNDTDIYGNNCFMLACLCGNISALET